MNYEIIYVVRISDSNGGTVKDLCAFDSINDLYESILKDNFVDFYIDEINFNYYASEFDTKIMNLDISDYYNSAGVSGTSIVLFNCEFSRIEIDKKDIIEYYLKNKIELIEKFKKL